MNASITEYRAMVAKPAKPSKYRNVKTTVDGIVFDSAKEARRWGELQLRERAGEIRFLRRQPRFPIAVNGVPICAYVADFAYVQEADDVQVIEDVKGVRTAVYRLKAKLMAAVHNIIIKEV